MIVEAQNGIVNLMTYEETILWQNSSPTSAFEAQNLTLSESIDDFDYLSITYAGTISESAPKIKIMFTPTDLRKSVASSPNPRIIISGHYGSNNYRLDRTLILNSVTSIAVSAASRVGASGTYNQAAIPLSVIGIKRVPITYGPWPKFGQQPDVVFNNADAPATGTATITVTQKPRYIVFTMTRKATTYVYYTAIIDVVNGIAWRTGYTSDTDRNEAWPGWTDVITSVTDSQVVIDYSAHNYEKRITAQIYY